jgi:ACR3 family arsenite efflux pump ArsB
VIEPLVEVLVMIFRVHLVLASAQRCFSLPDSEAVRA